MIASSRRALLRDIADGLLQQMFFWGCDARHASGNLLVRRGGLTRLPRPERGGEGSSRYRCAWQGGTIELHGFCAGWYPDDAAGAGVVFVRHRARLALVRGAEPLTPGRYEIDRLPAADPDAIATVCAPLVAWVAAYENVIAVAPGPAYRNACWRARRVLPGESAWLAPTAARAWWTRYLTDPATAPRARAFSG